MPMPPPPPVTQGAVGPLTITPMPAAPTAQPKKLGRTDSDYARELEEEDNASMSAMESDMKLAAELQAELNNADAVSSTPDGPTDAKGMLREMVREMGGQPLDEDLIAMLAEQIEMGQDQEMVLEQVLQMMSAGPSSPTPAYSKPVAPPPPVLVRSLSELKNEMEALNEKEECVVCMDERSNTVCIPCGHLCTCKDCAQPECPVCRKDVTQHITVAMDDMEAARELAKMYGGEVEQTTEEIVVPDTPKGLQRELHRRKQELLCSKCMQEDINCIMLPCGHRCCCYQCGQSRKAANEGCPFCSNEVTQVLKIYQGSR